MVTKVYSHFSLERSLGRPNRLSAMDTLQADMESSE